MGGNVFKNVMDVDRLDKNMYLYLKDGLKSCVWKTFMTSINYRGHQFALDEIPYNPNKESFGDIDLIIGYGGDLRKAINKFSREFFSEIADNNDFIFYREQVNGNTLHMLLGKSINDGKINGTVRSVVFQVDFIFVPFKSITFAKNYFSYGGVGALLGLLVKRHNFKISHTGLYYHHHTESVLVTTDWLSMLHLFEFNTEHFYALAETNEGFLDRLTSLVLSSILYQRGIFFDHNGEIKTNTCDIVNTVASHIKENEIDNLQSPADKIKEFSGGLFDIARRTFHDFNKEIVKIDNKRHSNKLFTEKFNGNIFKKVTGLPEGKELGDFIEFVKNQQERQLGDDRFKEKIINTDIDKLTKLYEDLYRIYIFFRNKEG